jgi:predicted transposase YbfD/YdcC
MSESAAPSLRQRLAALPDPRIERTKRHLLGDILFITLAAVLAGAEDCVALADFGRAKHAWFARWLELPNGIPSQDTFNRVLARLDPDAFRECFLAWVQPIRDKLAARTPPASGAEVIACDGKQLRGSRDATQGQSVLTMVSAWATSTRLVLGPGAVADKSNEITALPELLGLLDLAGCVVTIAAMGTQKQIARQIVEQGAEYLLALKDNHPALCQDVTLFFEHAQAPPFADLWVATYRQDDPGHGRQEHRRYWLVPLPAGIAWQDERGAWAGLESIGRVEATRTTATGTGRQVRYFLSSLSAQTPQAGRLFARAVRRHGGIENRLHWVLDIAFREDRCRLRKEHAAQNLATLRHLALNLLRQDKTAKMGILNRRLKAGWDESYLQALLTI